MVLSCWVCGGGGVGGAARREDYHDPRNTQSQSVGALLPPPLTRDEWGVRRLKLASGHPMHTVIVVKSGVSGQIERSN